MTLAINARFRGSTQTGVQRVAAELVAHLNLGAREIRPGRPLGGMAGHGWEQCVLPARLGGAPLWSPCNTGPVAVARQVVTIHDAAIFDHPEWFSRQFVATYRLLLPQLAKRARRIVTVSEYSRDRLARHLHLPEDAIAVVPNGVSEHFAPAPQADVSTISARHGVAPDNYFVTLGTLEPRKNLGLVIDAWQRAQPHLQPDMKLMLLGGAGGASIFAGGSGVAESAGIVRAGFVPDADLPALLSGARALLYPSRYEGFGLPPLEAMACGTAVVTTRATSLPEVCGDAALYVDPDDAAALATLMRDLAEDDARCAILATAGRARAAGFGWDAAAARMRVILQRDLDLP